MTFLVYAQKAFLLYIHLFHMANPYNSITARNGCRQYHSSGNRSVVLDVELKLCTESQESFRIGCETPPNRVILDYYGFNENLNENPPDSLMLGESSLLSEINQISNQLGNSNACYQDMEDTEGEEEEEEKEEDVEYCSLYQQRQQDLVIESSGLSPRFSSCLLEMGNSKAVENATKTKQKSSTGLSCVDTKQEQQPANLRIFSALQSLASSPEYKAYSPNTRRPSTTPDIYFKKLLLPSQSIISGKSSSESNIKQQDTKSILLYSKPFQRLQTRTQLQQGVSTESNKPSPKFFSVARSVFRDQNDVSSGFNSHNLPTLNHSDGASILQKAKLDHKAVTASKVARSGVSPDLTFNSAALEELQRRLNLSNPIPRPKHLLNHDGHFGLSPSSAERAIAVEQGHAKSHLHKAEMNTVPSLGPAAALQIEKEPARPRNIEAKTTTGSSSTPSLSNSPVIHPHHVALQDFGPYSRQSLSGPRSSSVQPMASRMMPQNGVSHQMSPGARKRSTVAGFGSPVLSRRTSLEKHYNKREALENEFDMPHHQKPTILSRGRDSRYSSTFDSPTPAGRASTIPNSDHHRGAIRRRMSSGSIGLREREDTSEIGFSGRTSSASNGSRQGQFVDLHKSASTHTHKRSESAAMFPMIGNSTVEKLDSVPFSLDSKVTTSTQTRDFYDGNVSPSQKSDVDLKSLQIELDGVKKLLGLLQDRIEQTQVHQHEESQMQPHYKNSDSDDVHKRVSQVDKVNNVDNVDKAGKVGKLGKVVNKVGLLNSKPSSKTINETSAAVSIEKEAKGLLEILESGAETLKSNTEIQRHLSSLSRGLEQTVAYADELKSTGRSNEKNSKADSVGIKPKKGKNQEQQRQRLSESANQQLDENKKNQQYSAKTTGVTRIESLSSPSSSSIKTVMLVFLTCSFMYAFLCLYLFLIDYTENTSTPY